MAYRDLVERVYEFHHLEAQVMDLFEKWIKNAKVLGLKPADLSARLAGEPPRTQAFGRCGIRLLEAYEEFLGKNRLVDFSDMIHEAIRHMEPRPQDYGRRYDHVLVDEFQDVSKDKVDLLLQLLTGDAHLFCVGDDWQSIFSFAGSDVKFFREFEACFGPSTTTILPDSFRCPAGVIEAGNRLMAYNKGQIPKQVVPRSTAQAVPEFHALADGEDYRQAVTWHARLWVHSLTDHGTAANDLRVLSRYRAPLAALAAWLRADGIAVREEDEPDEDARDGVLLQTIHKAKGGQAKHVLVLDVSEGSIPSLVEDPAVLSPVRLAALAPLEEERRLVYVALTRCQESLTLQGCPTRLSRFVQELALPPQSFRTVAAATARPAAGVVQVHATSPG
jgi:DNA helicase-4